MLVFFRRLDALVNVLFLGTSLIGIVFFLLSQSMPTPVATALATVPDEVTITSTVYLPLVQGKPETCYYVETDDAVVVEIESATAVEEWVLENAFAGFAGSGYYVWRGPNYLATPGIAILSYPISLTKQGTYRLNIHNWHPTYPSDMNDIWVRLDNREWIKGFSNIINQWTWDFNFERGSLGPADFYNVSPGLHTLQISARSTGFSLDRFALSTNGMGQLVNWPQSPCVVP